MITAYATLVAVVAGSRLINLRDEIGIQPGALGAGIIYAALLGWSLWVALHYGARC